MYGRGPGRDYDNDYYGPQSSHQGPMPSAWRANRPHHGTGYMPYAGGPRRPLINDPLNHMGGFHPPGMVGPHLMNQFNNYSDTDRRMMPPASVPQNIDHYSNRDDLYQDFNAPDRPWPIDVQFLTSAIMCNVNWTAPVQIQRGPEYVYRVEAHGANHQTMEMPSWRTHLKMKTTPGQWYTVEVKALVNEKVVGMGSTQFKAVFKREEMITLYHRALDYVGNDMHAFDVFYRCKPKPYFDNIKFNRSSIMEVYLKDNNGQAASPINGVISGLFWSARLTPSNTLPLHSPFGNIRMCVPAATLFDPRAHRLWFADFYCNYITHYATVVVTLRGSETDAYCEKCLIPLEPRNNPFLRCEPAAENPAWCAYWVNKKVWIETYYTENVPLNWGRFDEIIATGAGTSKPGGLPHNKYCTACNLYPIAPPPGAQNHIAGVQAANHDLDYIKSVNRKSGDGEEGDGDYCEEIRFDGSDGNNSLNTSCQSEYNTTLNLCVQLERDRIESDGNPEGGVDTEVGESDCIETLCSLVDAVVGQVGPLIKVPEHGFVGVPYNPSNRLQSDMDDALKSLDSLPNPILLSKAERDALKTKAGVAAYEHLMQAADDVDRRTNQAIAILQSLADTMNGLAKRMPITGMFFTLLDNRIGWHS